MHRETRIHTKPSNTHPPASQLHDATAPKEAGAVDAREPVEAPGQLLRAGPGVQAEGGLLRKGALAGLDVDCGGEAEGAEADGPEEVVVVVVVVVVGHSGEGADRVCCCSMGGVVVSDSRV